MVASTDRTLGAVVDVLVLRISLDDIRVPPAAAEYTQHDLSPVTDGRLARWFPTRHAGRTKARYLLAVTTVSPGQVRISAGSATAQRQNMIDYQ
jgi:hypothetical protein